MSERLRRGFYFDIARIRGVLWILAGFYAAALTLLLVTSDGVLDYAGRPLGVDFSNVYAAGRLAVEGRADAAWDVAVNHAAQQAAFDDPTIAATAWRSPPAFLFFAAALSFLPYTAAWLAWTAGTGAFYAAAMRLILPKRVALLAAASFPAVFVTILHGESGFLMAGLVGGGLALLDRRPRAAGVLLGLAAAEPIFAALAALTLAATARRETLAMMVAVALAIAVAATLVFGADIWRAYLASWSEANLAALAVAPEGWPRSQSVYAAVLVMGAGGEEAVAAQAALCVVVAGWTMLLWRSAASLETKAAGLIVASLLAAPAVMDYDLMLLAPALAFLAADSLKRGFAPYEKTILALAFFSPLIARPVAESSLLPIGLLALLGLFGLVLAKAWPRRPATLLSGADCAPL